MKRLFLDANVLFTAAHNPAGKAALVIELGGKGYWEVLTSTFAVEEARRNIALKFPDCLPRLEKFLADVAVFASRLCGSCSLSLSPQDRMIFLSALKCKATHLLTGDIKHFGPFMNNPNLTLGIIIQTVAEFLTSIKRK